MSDNPIDHEIINNLISRLEYIRIQPNHILLMGEQVDDAINPLQKRYPTAYITIAKTENEIPYNHFDLIISHLALLRAEKPQVVLKNFFNLLRDDGLLLLTSLGPDTFSELEYRFPNNVDMHYLGDWLRDAHFSDPVVDREEILFSYDSYDVLQQDLEKINLLPAEVLRSVRKKIPQHFVAQKSFSLTVEAIYGHGWKLTSSAQQNTNEIIIPIDQIRR